MSVFEDTFVRVYVLVVLVLVGVAGVLYVADKQWQLFAYAPVDDIIICLLPGEEDRPVVIKNEVPLSANMSAQDLERILAAMKVRPPTSCTFRDKMVTLDWEEVEKNLY